MAFDMKDFDRRMGILKNTMKEKVEAGLPHLQWVDGLTDDEVREKHEQKMRPLNRIFGEKPGPVLE